MAAARWLAFKVPLMSMNETNPTMNRAAATVVENWKAFGIDTTLDSQANPWPIMSSGEYSANLAWTIETWGGDPDLFFFLQSWHSKFYVAERHNPLPAATACAGRTPSSTRSSKTSRRSPSTIPKGVDLGQQFVKLAAQEMPITPHHGVQRLHDHGHHLLHRVSIVDDPYTDPVPNWGNTKYMFVKIKPKKCITSPLLRSRL